MLFSIHISLKNTLKTFIFYNQMMVFTKYDDVEKKKELHIHPVAYQNNPVLSNLLNCKFQGPGTQIPRLRTAG